MTMVVDLSMELGAMKMTTLGERIRRLRMALGLSQGAVAHAIGAGRHATVSAWERDRSAPDRGTLRLLADLSSNADEVYLWLLQGGTQPPLQSRAARADGAPIAVMPPLPHVSASANDADVQRAYGAFAQRVASLAAAGQVVPAHYLLEWAAMLLRTSELYQLVSKRLALVLKELPIMVIELDREQKIIAYHAGGQDSGDPTYDQVIGRTVADVLPQVPEKQLAQAIARAQEGVTSDFVYELQFQDGSRQYTARAYMLPDQHTMLFINRAAPSRADELGIQKRVTTGGVA